MVRLQDDEMSSKITSANRGDRFEKLLERKIDKALYTWAGVGERMEQKKTQTTWYAMQKSHNNIHFCHSGTQVSARMSTIVLLSEILRGRGIWIIVIHPRFQILRNMSLI